MAMGLKSIAGRGLVTKCLTDRVRFGPALEETTLLKKTQRTRYSPPLHCEILYASAHEVYPQSTTATTASQRQDNKIFNVMSLSFHARSYIVDVLLYPNWNNYPLLFTTNITV